MKLGRVALLSISLVGQTVGCQRGLIAAPTAATELDLEREPGAGRNPPDERRAEPSLEPAAVVELFTSEGCSSCPRADEFAASLQARTRRTGSRVFVLSYHVHYWDVLGHTDRFGARRFTERQRWYAESWGTTRVYTPQLVIGGTEDVSGNDRQGALIVVSKQLDQATKVGITLTAELIGRTCRVRYEVAPARRNDYLTVALIQDQAQTQVATGENGGLTLHHVNVVRDAALSHVGSGTGTWSAEIPSDMPSGSVVAYVQQARTRRVLGVSQVRVLD